MWPSSAKNLHPAGLGLVVTEQNINHGAFNQVDAIAGSSQYSACTTWNPRVFLLDTVGTAQALSSSSEDSPQAGGVTLPIRPREAKVPGSLCSSPPLLWIDWLEKNENPANRPWVRKIGDFVYIPGILVELHLTVHACGLFSLSCLASPTSFWVYSESVSLMHPQYTNPCPNVPFSGTQPKAEVHLQLK